MAIKNVKGVVVDVVKNEIYVKEITYDDVKDDYLDEYYKVLNCDTFDIVNRRFGKYCLDVYCDDEGLLKEDKKVALVTYKGSQIVEIICGNVFIVGHKEAETISLTDDEINEVFKYCKQVFISNKVRKIVVASV